MTPLSLRYRERLINADFGKVLQRTLYIPYDLLISSSTNDRTQWAVEYGFDKEHPIIYDGSQMIQWVEVPQNYRRKNKAKPSKAPTTITTKSYREYTAHMLYKKDHPECNRSWWSLPKATRERYYSMKAYDAVREWMDQNKR